MALPLFLQLLFLILGLVSYGVKAYIPATAVNVSSPNVAGAPNMSDVSMLYLQWYMGSYSETVSYQLVGNGSNGISQGALVHFSESMSWNNETTTTPWIALVSCDTNATNASQVDDIFTLARDRGAKSALLYSLTATAQCIINPEYANPENFDQVMDIFSTQSLTSAQLIEYQFGAINRTVYGNYNAQLLNQSATVINNTLNNGSMNVSSYIFAKLQAYNATGDGGAVGTQDSTPSNSTGTGSGGQNSPSTGLAMIILYAITGCVSALFCIVIVTGAVRAIRNPERYGPRAGEFHGGFGGSFAQSRTQGLTRAILDTFPVIKFGRSTAGADLGDGSVRDMHLKGVEMVPAASPAVTSGNAAKIEDVDADGKGEGQTSVQQALGADQVEAGTSIAAGPTFARRPSGRAPPAEEVVPDAIGRETCPICILDFEEGDDLRVLPCEGKHKFHQQCVDPWLLELSSSCPICRHDFHALETMMSGENDGPPHDYYSNNIRDSSGGGNRFSRYLRSAIRRRRYREGAGGYDPTDPYMPYAPETGL